MKFIKYIFLLVALCTVQFSCDDGFDEINTNPNAANEINPDFQFSYCQLTTSGERYENWRAVLIYSSVNMRLSSSAYEMDYALLNGVSGAQGGASGSGGGISSSAGFSAGTGGGGGGGGAQGDGNSGLAGGADDFVGGTDDGMRDEERWGRARV